MLPINMGIITFKATDRHNENVVVQFCMQLTLCKNIAWIITKHCVDTLLTQCGWEASPGFPILKPDMFVLKRLTRIVEFGRDCRAVSSHILSLYKNEDSAIHLGDIFPVFAQCDNKKGFLDVSLQFPVFVCVLWLTGHHWLTPVSLFLLCFPSLRHLFTMLSAFISVNFS